MPDKYKFKGLKLYTEMYLLWYVIIKGKDVQTENRTRGIG